MVLDKASCDLLQYLMDQETFDGSRNVQNDYGDFERFERIKKENLLSH